MYKPLIKTLTLFLHSLDHFSMRSSSSVPAWITKYIHINIKTCQCTRTVVYWYWCLYLRWKETFGYPATNQAWTLCWLGIAGRPRGLVIHDIAIRRINNHPLNRVAYFVHAGHIGYWPSVRSVWDGWILTKFLFFACFWIETEAYKHEKRTRPIFSHIEVILCWSSVLQVGGQYGIRNKFFQWIAWFVLLTLIRWITLSSLRTTGPKFARSCSCISCSTAGKSYCNVNNDFVLK